MIDLDINNNLDKVKKKTAVFDVQKIYNFLFGYRGIPFPASDLSYDLLESRLNSLKSFENVLNVNNGSSLKTVKMSPKFSKKTGMKYFLPTTVCANGKCYEFPNEPTFSLSTRKEIVKTTIVGNSEKGTIKELVNFSDWIIDIRGVIINEDGKFPLDEIKEMQKVFEYDGSFEIKNEFVNSVGVDKVIFESLEFVEMAGVEHAQGYVLKAISDGDFILDIEE